MVFPRYQEYFTKNAAFTLIEVLVAIAIMGVLAAIMIPVVGSFQSQANERKCLANLKQIGAAMFSYAADNNGLLPPLRQGINSGDVWQQVLVANKYTSQATMFCPAATKAGRGWNGTHPDYGASTRTSGNNALVGSRVGLLGDANAPRRLAAINNPSKTLFVSDACAPAVNVFRGTWSLDLRWFLQPTSAISQSGIAPRHGIKNNDILTGSFAALFADGHVKMMNWNDPSFQDVAFLRQFLHAE
jgi:prepilin-type N-terminal cleavage/methylation domain-containing protein/prepilin-type processing-associated H-X9-DG protein